MQQPAIEGVAENDATVVDEEVPVEDAAGEQPVEGIIQAEEPSGATAETPSDETPADEGAATGDPTATPAETVDSTEASTPCGRHHGRKPRRGRSRYTIR